MSDGSTRCDSRAGARPGASLGDRRLLAAALLTAALSTTAVVAADRVTQRVWLLDGVPGDTTLAALRAGGVDGLVLPVGEVAVSGSACRLTAAPLPDLKTLAGWPVTPLVWAAGQGDASGDAKTFAGELAPVLRLVPHGSGLVLAARSEWPGLVGFAASIAGEMNAAVEVVVPAQAARKLAAGRLPPGVTLAVVAFGNPPALGFPPSTITDDLAALEALDAAGAAYRAVLVVAPRATPSPGPAGASLSAIALPSVADFQPAERGDAFVLRQAVNWGGTRLEPPTAIKVELVDTARYHRDLGLVLRPVRPQLAGWDVAGLPKAEPTLGMSLEAFLDYTRGGQPFPTLQVQSDWVTPTRLRLALANPTPQASALASTGNWLEVSFGGAQLLEVGLGDFSGADYGRVEDGRWRRCVARDATALRLFLTYVPPASRTGGAAVTFMSRPSEVSARWVVRLGDGGEAAGEPQPVPLKKP